MMLCDRPACCSRAEAVVSERALKLRNVLTVMGCGFDAYWFGHLLGDLALYAVIYVAALAVVFGCGMTRWFETSAILWFLPLFGVQLIAFSYALSWAFGSPRVAIAAIPAINVILLFAPQARGLATDYLHTAMYSFLSC